MTSADDSIAENLVPEAGTLIRPAPQLDGMQGDPRTDDRLDLDFDDEETSDEENALAHAGMAGVSDRLTESEKEELEASVRRFRELEESWIEGTRILCEIRDRRLFRERYKTFEEFCQNELDMTRANLNRRIRCGRLAAQLETIVAKPKEAHLRPLLSIEMNSDLQKRCFRKAVDRAKKEKRPLRTADVQSAVQNALGKANPAPHGTNGGSVSGNAVADVITRLSRTLRAGLEKYEVEQLEVLERRINAAKELWVREIEKNQTGEPEQEGGLDARA